MRSTACKIACAVLLPFALLADWRADFDDACAAVLSYSYPSWSPPTNCILWLEADSGVLLNGSSVTNWSDKSVAGNNATNALGTASYITNRANGMPVVHFNGTNSWLFTPADPANSAHTIIFVAAVTGSGVDEYSPEMTYYAPSADRGAPHYVKNNLTGASYPLYPYGGYYDNVGSYYAYNTFYIFALPFEIGTWTGWKNGSSESASLTQATAYQSDVIGMALGRQTSPARYWCGDIAAVFIFTRKLSNAEINTVQAYLSAKYGISVSQLP